MAETLTFKIIVTDNGGTKIAEQNVTRLGSAVEGAAKKQRAAKKDAADFFDTQAKGIIGTANGTKSFSKLAETIGGNSSGLVAAYATLAANTFAVTAAFNALRGASQVEQIFKGLEAAGIRTGRSLTSTAMALKEVTGNAISTEQALRSTAQIASAGFGSDSIQRLGKAARDTSFALGRNMTDSLDRLSRGVVKLEPELLDELGIMTKLTESNTLYAAKLGKTETQLSNFEKRQGFLNAVLTEAELKFGGLAESAGDTTAYDKLASRFSDLSNQILNTVNTIAKPIAGILASSTGLLLGVAISFVATLRNQLIPGLARSVTASAEAAKGLRGLAKEKLAAVEAAKALAIAENKQALASKMNFAFVAQGPAKFREVSAAVRDGTASIEQQQQALTSLGRSYNANAQILANNKNFTPGTDKGNAKITENATIAQEMAAIRGLQQARADADKMDIASNAKVTAARVAARVASLESIAQTSAAASLGAASQGKLSIAWTQLALSVKAYSRAQEIASGEGVTGMTRLRTAVFAASTATKVLGTAFLSVLPYIGLIVAGFGILSSGLEALKSDKTKAIEKAFSDLGEVTTKTSAYVKELNRTNESLAPIALRTAQAITIQSNAISEVTDKFNELLDASNKLESKTSFWDSLANLFSGKGRQGVAGFFDTGDISGAASYLLQVDQNSKALEVAANKLGYGARELTSDKALGGAIQTLDELQRVAPKATEEVVKLYGGWQALNATDATGFKLAVKGIADEVNSRFKDSATNVQNLQQAFKSLDQSLGAFSLSSAIGTQYDQVVKDFNSVTMAIQTMRQAAITTKDQDWSKLLAGIPPNALQYLDASTQKQLALFTVADQTNQRLTKMQDMGQKLSATDSDRLTIARNTLATGSQLFSNIEQQTKANDQLFISAQKSERVYKSQLELLNAHIAANQALYAAAGAGIRARIAQEEKVRAIQASQIKLEIQIQQTRINGVQAQIRELETRGAINVEAAETLKKEQEITKEALKRQLLAQNIAVSNIESGSLTGGAYVASKTGRGGPTEETKQVGELIDAYRTLSTVNDKAADQQLADANAIAAKRQLIRDSEASIINLRNQLSVLDEQQLTSAQKLAMIRQGDIEYQVSVLNTLKEQRSSLAEINSAYADTNAIINGTNDSLSNQLSIIERQAAVQRVDAVAQANARVASAKVQVDLAKAAATRSGLDANEREAAKVLVANAQQQLTLQQQQQQIDLDRINSQEQLNIVQKVYFDTAKEGLDWQRNSLDLLNKQLDATRGLAEETAKTFELQLRLNARRQGIDLSDQSTQAIEIEAARSTLNLAIQESSVKKALIDLEYALLDAQKDQLSADLRARRDKIADRNDPRDATRLNQLTSTIDRLESIDLTKISETAKATIDRAIYNQRLELETALTPKSKGGFFGDLVSATQGYKDIQSAIERARTDSVKPLEVTSIVKADTQAQKEALSQAVDPVVSSNMTLVTTITKWIEVVEKAIGAASLSAAAGGEVSGSATGRVGQALDFFMKNGLSANQAAGLVGNLQQESDATLDPTKRNKASGAYGIGQWLSKDRIDNFAKKFGHSIQMSTFMEQLQFVLHELNTTEKKAGDALRNTTTLADATLTVRKKYERPGEAEANDARRLSYASKLVNQRPIPIAATNAVVPVAGAVQDPEESVVYGKSARSAPIGYKESLVSAGDNIDIGDISKMPTQKAPTDFSKAKNALSTFEAYTSKIVENLRALGPDGELIAAVSEGMASLGNGVIKVMEAMEETGGSAAERFAGRFTAIAGVAASALSTIQSATAATAQSKEDAIQREIDAETRRDGKSAESVAKIAAMEKKKDEIARKQFNLNKKLMMAQSIIATATAVVQALTLGPIVGPIMAGVIGAMGAAQLAIIAGTSYQSTSSAAAASAAPATLSIGKQGDTVDLAKQNTNVGGELGYLRGKPGTGNNSSNYSVIGSAYGGGLGRGYGNTAYAIGEKGPEILTPDTPVTITPMNDNHKSGSPMEATINIHALDASGVEDILTNQKGNIIRMLRDAANTDGQTFLENVNTNTYSRPNKTGNSRL